jgi:hypothetical protein
MAQDSGTTPSASTGVSPSHRSATCLWGEGWGGVGGGWLGGERGRLGCSGPELRCGGRGVQLTGQGGGEGGRCPGEGGGQAPRGGGGGAGAQGGEGGRSPGGRPRPSPVPHSPRPCAGGRLRRGAAHKRLARRKGRRGATCLSLSAGSMWPATASSQMDRL